MAVEAAALARFIKLMASVMDITGCIEAFGGKSLSLEQSCISSLMIVKDWQQCEHNNGKVKGLKTLQSERIFGDR